MVNRRKKQKPKPAPQVESESDEDTSLTDDGEDAEEETPRAVSKIVLRLPVMGCSSGTAQGSAAGGERNHPRIVLKLSAASLTAGGIKDKEKGGNNIDEDELEEGEGEGDGEGEGGGEGGGEGEENLNKGGVKGGKGRKGRKGKGKGKVKARTGEDGEGTTPSAEGAVAKPPMALGKVTTTLLNHLVRHDQYSVFYEPVDPLLVPDYLSVVKHPMDFLTIRGKLETESYGTFAAFLADLDLVFENAKLYNKPHTIFYKQANRLQNYVQSRIHVYTSRLLQHLVGDIDAEKHLVTLRKPGARHNEKLKPPKIKLPKHGRHQRRPAKTARSDASSLDPLQEGGTPLASSPAFADSAAEPVGVERRSKRPRLHRNQSSLANPSNSPAVTAGGSSAAAIAANLSSPATLSIGSAFGTFSPLSALASNSTSASSSSANANNGWTTDPSQSPSPSLLRPSYQLSRMPDFRSSFPLAPRTHMQSLLATIAPPDVPRRLYATLESLQQLPAPPRRQKTVSSYSVFEEEAGIPTSSVLNGPLLTFDHLPTVDVSQLAPKTVPPSTSLFHEFLARSDQGEVCSTLSHLFPNSKLSQYLSASSLSSVQLSSDSGSSDSDLSDDVDAEADVRGQVNVDGDDDRAASEAGFSLPSTTDEQVFDHNARLIMELQMHQYQDTPLPSRQPHVQSFGEGLVHLIAQTPPNLLASSEAIRAARLPLTH